jgi:heterodisulfide reductase subunit D
MDKGNKNFTVKQRLELDACTRCGECMAYCETYGPRHTEYVNPALKIKYFRSLLKEEEGPRWLSWLYRMDRPKAMDMKEFALGVYQCTLCALCVSVCPVNIDLLDLWKSMREDLVDRELAPDNLDIARINVQTTRNVLGYPNEERALWIDFMEDPPEDGFYREHADVVYFVGCMSSFSPAAQDIAETYCRLLEEAGLSFTILGEDEFCCSFPLIVAGMHKEGEEVRRHNIETILGYSPKIITFSCPSCYNTFIKHYKDAFPGVEMLHSTQLMRRLIKEGRVQLKSGEGRITFHDPCDLGRNSGEYEAPRDVLGSIPGVEFTEMGFYRELAKCCGGGGDLEIYDPELAEEVNLDTLREAEATGAETMITGCPQCKRMFQAGTKKCGSTLQIKDIVQVVYEQVDRGAKAASGQEPRGGIEDADD